MMVSAVCGTWNGCWTKKNTTESKLVFMGYDANLYPTPNFSTWTESDWKQKQIDIVLRRARDFEGEVWLDDVKIR